ncbi:MAG: efflux RND transporter periplasmic adaptor subunit [Anaerolineales bacterium]
MYKSFAWIVLIAFLVSGCSGAAATATAAPTSNIPKSIQQSLSLTVNGQGVLAQSAKLGFSVSGKIAHVLVKAGDPVKAGQLLADLENADAQMQVDQADRSLKEMTSPAAIAAAAQAVAAAQQTLADTQKKTDGMFFPRASDALIQNTQAEIDLARQQLARASNAYKPLADLPDGDTRKAAALIAMTNAQLNLNRLIAQYNWYAGTPTDIDAAAARANLEAAKAAAQEDQWYLSALNGEQIPANATGSKLAQLQLARDDLAAARQKLDATQLVTPISGTVITVNGMAGELASPGVIFMVISDLAHLQVETTNLGEDDVPNVQVGQAVTVTIKALNQTMTGHVLTISPVADSLGGDVVYKTTIDLDLPLPQGLRAGMSAVVQFETK